MTRPLRIATLVAMIAAPALAQCEPGWVPEMANSQWSVYSALVLPDGDLVVGGLIGWRGDPPAQGIARRNARTGQWSALGGGIDGPVHALALMPNGDIVAGGDFEHAGGLPVNSIARWDGLAWHPLGNGVGMLPQQRGSVYALAPLPSGELLVGGIFDFAGGVPVTSIARWDGVTWHSIEAILEGAEVSNSVYALLPLVNGGIVVAGSFYSVNGVAARSVARWDGTTWTAMGFGLGTTVRRLAQLEDGSIVAAGGFMVPLPGRSGLNRIARWSGDEWEPIGPGVNGTIESMAVRPNGELIIGGQFAPGPYTTATRVARWDGSAWVGLGTGIAGTLPRVRSIVAMPNGDVVVGGTFATAGGIPSPGLATYSFGGHCCPADLDNDGDFANGLTRDGAVTIEDLLSFLVGFEAGNVLVDLDNDGDPATGTPDNAVDINDLLFFLARFEAGC